MLIAGNVLTSNMLREPVGIASRKGSTIWKCFTILSQTKQKKNGSTVEIDPHDAYCRYA